MDYRSIQYHKNFLQKIFAAVWFHETKKPTGESIRVRKLLLHIKMQLVPIHQILLLLRLLLLLLFLHQHPQGLLTLEMVAKMGMGINLGNTLEAPYEGSWSKEAMEYYFDDYKDAGYKNVRIPIRWDNHTMNTYPYTIDKNFWIGLKK